MKTQIYFLAALLALTGCDSIKDIKKDINNSTNKAHELKSHINVEMKKVRGLFVSSLAEGSSDLMAIDVTGSVTAVKVTEEGKNSASWVHDSPAYVFIRFDNVSYAGSFCEMVAVRKDDGSLFCIPEMIENCGNSCSWYYPPVQSDSAGDHLYAFIGQKGLLVMFALNTIEDSSMTEITSNQSGGAPNAFQVNSKGDLLATIPVMGGNETEVRLYKAAGGFAKINSSKARTNCLFAGPGSGREGLFFLDGEQQNVFTRIVRVDNLDAGVTTSTYADVTTLFTTLRPDSGNGACEGASRAETADRTFFRLIARRTDVPDENSLVEVGNPSAAPRLHLASDFSYINQIYGCDTGVVVHGKDTAGKEIFSKFTPETGLYSTFFAVGDDYVISKVTLDRACNVVFGGRRATDNARIVGNVDPATQKVSIIAESADRDITAVQMIR